ncbi:MAG: hypothetical protein JWO13_2263 [Acidobacteriales bacterium]|nr:hypothetical protein [Terriglobales bacterium]
MALMTQKEYAAKKKVSAQYINKLVTQGKIALVGKKVESKQADAAIAATKRHGRLIQPKRSASKASKKTAVRIRKEKAPKPPKVDSATRKAAASRADREFWEAKTAQRKYEQMTGLLLPRDQVLEAERMKNSNIRSKLRALPRELALALSTATTPAEAEKLLLDEIDALLDRLAKDPLGMEEAARPVAPLEDIPEVGGPIVMPPASDVEARV